MKLYYFGTDKQAAYQRYLQETAALHGTAAAVVSVGTTDLTVKDVTNHFLAHQHQRMTIGEIAAVHFNDCQTVLRA